MEHYDFSVHRGETFYKPVYFENSDHTPMDLTGREGYAQVRAYPKTCPTDPVQTICEITVTIDDPENGKVVLSIPAYETWELAADSYAYDFCMKDEENIVRYYFGGAFQVLPSVTEVDDD